MRCPGVPHDVQSSLFWRITTPTYSTIGVFLKILSWRLVTRFKNKKWKRKPKWEKQLRSSQSLSVWERMPQASRDLSNSMCMLAVTGYTMLCPETFLFPDSLGKWRNNIAVECKLESMLKTSGCKFQKYLTSLLVSSRGRKPDCFKLISKSLWNHLMILNCRNLS